MSENVRVKVSSILPVFIQTVLHGQQREEARVSVCLVAVDTRPPFLSPCTAIKLAARVTFDKKGKSHVRAHLPTERRAAQWNVSALICPKSLQTWLTGIYVKVTFLGQ